MILILIDFLICSVFISKFLTECHETSDFINPYKFFLNGNVSTSEKLFWKYWLLSLKNSLGQCLKNLYL